MLQVERSAPSDGLVAPRPAPPAPTRALPAALVQLTAVLCLGLFLEVVAAMRPLLGPGGSPWAWLPVVFLPIALVLALAVEVAPHPVCIRAYGAAMGLAVLVGVLGTAFHLAAHGLLGPHWVRWLHFDSWVGDPPVFAPMSFALLGLLGGAAPVLASASRGPTAEAPVGTARWAALGVPAGLWRIQAAASAALGLLGIGLEVSPARAIGVLAILLASAWQALTILGTLRVGSRAPGARLRTLEGMAAAGAQTYAGHAD